MIATTQAQIDALREGGKRLARHVRILSEMVAPGVTALEIEMKARKLVSDEGDTMAFYQYRTRKGDEPYPSGLCLSINEALVHSPAATNGRTIQEGDVVKLDFGIKHAGYFTDHAVTVIAGKSRAESDLVLLRGTQEALAVGIEAAQLGNTTGDIGHAVEVVADFHGFGYPRNLSGHGVGTAVHEEPYVPNFGAPGSGEVLVEGLVIAIEPMMTLGNGALTIGPDGHAYCTKDGSRSAHFEHTILITKDGPEILTVE